MITNDVVSNNDADKFVIPYLSTAGRRKTEVEKPAQEEVEEEEPDVVPASPPRDALPLALDEGSTKKSKKQKKDPSKKGQAPQKYPGYDGLERPHQFKTGFPRHFFVESGLLKLAVEVKAGRKAWIPDATKWYKELFVPGQKPGIPARPGFQFDLAFICFPHNMRSRVEQRPVLAINKWNADLPTNFFFLLFRWLSKDGFLAVMHSGDHDHRTQIFNAAKNCKFKHVFTYNVVLPEPLYHEHLDMQVTCFSSIAICSVFAEPITNDVVSNRGKLKFFLMDDIANDVVSNRFIVQFSALLLYY